MGNGSGSAGLQIGQVLKEARRRAGLDIRTAEERTKIRTRYLRALEDEQWEALPGHAYVKGFLRTYATLLGLDGEALVDEYRRTVEGVAASPVPLGDNVLQARRPLRDPGEFESRRGRGLIAGGAVAAVALILLVLGVTGGGDNGTDSRETSKRDRTDRGSSDDRGDAQGGRRSRDGEAGGGKGGRKGGGNANGEGRKQPRSKSVRLRLVSKADGLTVCLLGNGDDPLIDGQSLSAGSKDSFEAKRFELRFPFGYDRDQFNVFLDGKRAKLPELRGPAAFEIESAGELRQLDPPPGTACP